jgi:hypothetical protein
MQGFCLILLQGSFGSLVQGWMVGYLERMELALRAHRALLRIEMCDFRNGLWIVPGNACTVVLPIVIAQCGWMQGGFWFALRIATWSKKSKAKGVATASPPGFEPWTIHMWGSWNTHYATGPMRATRFRGQRGPGAPGMYGRMSAWRLRMRTRCPRLTSTGSEGKRGGDCLPAGVRTVDHSHVGQLDYPLCYRTDESSAVRSAEGPGGTRKGWEDSRGVFATYRSAHAVYRDWIYNID